SRDANIYASIMALRRANRWTFAGRIGTEKSRPPCKRVNCWLSKIVSHESSPCSFSSNDNLESAHFLTTIASHRAHHVHQRHDGSERLLKADPLIGAGERHLAHETIVFGGP